MTARSRGWAILAGGALAAAAALGWVTLEALALEREGARAKAEARFEERVRLALWRMDSYLAPVIAAEAVRPHFHYAPFYAEEDAFTRAWNDIPAGEVLVASPLLNYDNPNGYIHFEVPPEGCVRSPQVPEGVMGKNAVPTYLTGEELAAARSKLGDLRAMLSPDDISGLRARAGEGRMTELVAPAAEPPAAEPPSDENTRLSLSAVLEEVNARGSFPPAGDAGGAQPTQAGQVAEAQGVAQQAPAIAMGQGDAAAQPQQARTPLQAEQETQRLISGQEFQLRRNVSSRRRRAPPSRPSKGAPAPAEAATASPENKTRERPSVGKATPAPPESKPSDSREVVPPGIAPPKTAPLEVAPSGIVQPVPVEPPSLPEQATTSGSSERLKLGSLVPTWVGADENELVLVRVVERGEGGESGELGGQVGEGGRRYVQGIWLRWPEIRSRLLAQVRDLLPGARLEPAPGGAPDPARALASVPAALDPGEVALPASDASLLADGASLTPTRVALLAAWAALAAALVTSALSLRAANDLSDRRARFVSTVTHELRTPLTTFQLYTDMLASGMAPPESREEYLATLKGEAERLALLVENVLAYARLEDGRVAREPAPVDAGELIDGALSRARERAEACGMRLEVDVAPDVASATALADSAAVEQIVFNLVDNACKHAVPGDGDAREADDGRKPDDARCAISVRAGLEGRALVVRVADNGPGVPGPERRRIFEPFHRAEGATAAGAGLGLALSRNLARAGGGDLTCDPPPPGGGAVFALRVPLA
ncbi:MAG: sensor histidine kinase [Planctomycetota bacterium]|jgi:signal transduction histidine kinase